MSVFTSAIDVSQSDSLSLDLSQIKREQRHVANLLRYATDKPLYNVQHRLSTGQVAERDEHEKLNWISKANRQTDTQKHTYSVTSRHTDRQTRRHTDTGILKLQRLRTNTPITPVSTDDINLSTQQSSQQYTVMQLCDDIVDLSGPISPRRPGSPRGLAPGPAPVSQLTLPDINTHTVQGDLSTQVERVQTVVVKLPQIHQELQTPTPPCNPGLTVTSRNNNDDVIMLHGLFASRDSSAVTSRSHTCAVMPLDEQDTTTTSYRHVLVNNNNNNNNNRRTVDIVAKSEFTAAAVVANDELLIDNKFSQLPETTTTTTTTTCDEIPTFNILLPQSTVATYFRSHDWLGQEISRAFVYSYYDLLPVLGSIQKNKKNRKLNKK